MFKITQVRRIKKVWDIFRTDQSFYLNKPSKDWKWWWDQFLADEDVYYRAKLANSNNYPSSLLLPKSEVMKLVNAFRFQFYEKNVFPFPDLQSKFKIQLFYTFIDRFFTFFPFCWKKFFFSCCVFFFRFVFNHNYICIFM